MAVYKRGDVYWLSYSDEKNVRRRVSLRCSIKHVAERAARKILEGVELRRAGVLTPGEDAARIPLPQHLEAFERSLRAGAQHERETMSVLRRATEGMRKLKEFDLAAANRWLLTEKSKGRAINTLNHHRAKLLKFSGWLYETDRVARDPLKGLKKFKPRPEGEVDGEGFDRRPLDAEEVERLLEVSPEPRRTCYLVAITTGLRRGELEGLRWSDVDLDAGQLTVRASVAKNRKTAHLPLPRRTVDALRSLRDRSWAREELARIQRARVEHRTETAAAEALGWHRSVLRRRAARLGELLELPDPRNVFPGGAWNFPRGRGRGVPSVDQLRADLEAAEIPWEEEGSVEVVDFHALRTTFGTLLARAEVPLVVAQRLMRHSTPDLTSRFYTRVRSLDQRAALARTFPGPSCAENRDGNGLVPETVTPNIPLYAVSDGPTPDGRLPQAAQA